MALHAVGKHFYDVTIQSPPLTDSKTLAINIQLSYMSIHLAYSGLIVATVSLQEWHLQNFLGTS